MIMTKIKYKGFTIRKNGDNNYQENPDGTLPLKLQKLEQRDMSTDKTKVVITKGTTEAETIAAIEQAINDRIAEQQQQPIPNDEPDQEMEDTKAMLNSFDDE